MVWLAPPPPPPPPALPPKMPVILQTTYFKCIFMNKKFLHFHLNFTEVCHWRSIWHTNCAHAFVVEHHLLNKWSCLVDLLNCKYHVFEPMHGDSNWNTLKCSPQGKYYFIIEHFSCFRDNAITFTTFYCWTSNEETNYVYYQLWPIIFAYIHSHNPIIINDRTIYNSWEII